MPEFTVKFGGSVTYQPSHPKVNRVIGELQVHAPTVQGAYWHAAKVCDGAWYPIAVYDEAGALLWGDPKAKFAPTPPVAPVVEVPNDVAQVHDYA